MVVARLVGIGRSLTDYVAVGVRQKRALLRPECLHAADTSRARCRYLCSTLVDHRSVRSATLLFVKGPHSCLVHPGAHIPPRPALQVVWQQPWLGHPRTSTVSPSPPRQPPPTRTSQPAHRHAALDVGLHAQAQQLARKGLAPEQAAGQLETCPGRASWLPEQQPVAQLGQPACAAHAIQRIGPLYSQLHSPLTALSMPATPHQARHLTTMPACRRPSPLRQPPIPSTTSHTATQPPSLLKYHRTACTVAHDPHPPLPACSTHTPGCLDSD